jgi:dihydrofolate reductase
MVNLMCRSVENHFGTGLILSCVWENEFVPYENLTVLNTRPQLYIIAAMSENHVIGRNNRLPWHLPDEWAHFRKVTSGPRSVGPRSAGKAFIMGRKSFEAPDALHSPYRNVIVTSNPPTNPTPLVEYAKDISEAIALLSGETDVFVLGGASIFQQMLPLADRMYLTIVHAQIEGDAYFPAFDPDDWQLTSSEFHDTDDAHAYSFSMNLYIRKQLE